MHASRQKGAAARQPQRRGARPACTWVCWPGWRGTGWDSFGPRSSCPRRRSSSARWCASSLTARGPTRRWALRRFFPKDKTGQSMPSRHCFSAAAIAGTAWYVLPPLGAVLAVLGVLIAISRVVTGVHYISDVLAGLAFGSVFAVLGWNAFVLAASALGFYAIMLL